MADTRRRRIPSLVPDGHGHARVERTYVPRQRTGRKPDAERLVSEPWRATGYSREYRASRQQVIAAAGGRCQMCGKVVAHLVDGRWRCDAGGQVHHVDALRDGGDATPARKMLLCPSCHARLDATRRRGA